MPDIKVNNTATPLSVQLKAESLQDFGYVINVIDTSHNVIESHNGNLDNMTDTAIVALNKTADAYIECFINGVVTIGDPAGAGNNYDLEFSLLQNGAGLLPVISLTGTTTANDITRFPQ